MPLAQLKLRMFVFLCCPALTLVWPCQQVSGQRPTPSGASRTSRLGTETASSYAQSKQLVVKAKALVESMHSEQALALLNKAIALEPTNALAYFYRGEAIRTSSGEVGDINLAKADYETAIKFNPSLEEAYCSLAMLYSESGNNDMAFKTIDRLPKKTTKSSSVHSALAEIYAVSQRYDSAISEYTWLLKSEPNRQDFWRNRGICYAALKKYLLAIADYNALIALNKHDTHSLRLRASAYEHLGRWSDAAADYQRIAIIEPKNDTGYKLHAEAMIHLGRLREAITDYTKVLTFAPDDIDAITCRGETYMKLGDSGRALKDLSAAISKEPESAKRAYLLRAQYYQANGSIAKAQADLAKAKQL